MSPAGTENARGPLRVLRAAVFALAAVLLAATAHLAGGGALPSLPELAFLCVPLAWGSVALTGRRRGRTAVLAALAGAQVGLHEAFMVLAAPTCGAPAGAAAMVAMHGAGGTVTALHACSTAAMPPMAPMASMSWTAGGVLAAASVMGAAHIVATVLTALLLAHGERLVAVLPALLLGLLLARALRWATAVVPALPRVVRAVPTRSRAASACDLVRDVLSRRGPPDGVRVVTTA